ncbi:MAG TPA: hypothetical protein VIJ85_13260 [Rhizomicrobium sp.]
MIAGIILCIVGLGAFCVLLFNFAVYMLPAYIGLSAGWWAINSGAGVGGILVGLAAGVFVFLLGQVFLAWNRSLVLRSLVILIFAVPAAYAGYSIVLQISELGIPSPIWRHVFAVIGSIAIGCTTIARLTSLPDVRPLRGPAALVQVRPRPTGLQETILAPERQELLPPPRHR